MAWDKGPSYRAKRALEEVGLGARLEHVPGEALRARVERVLVEGRGGFREPGRRGLRVLLLRRGELERARFYVRRINSLPDQVTAQSLWLAARIERRLGNMEGLQDFGRQLRERFPQSPETLQFERGRFED